MAATPKPTILCLHGGGTNALIFNIQTIRLQRALPQFAFHFPDAPFPAPPGPGVLPFFDGCDPYFSWLSDRGQADMHPDTWALIQRLEAEQRAKDGRGFVGVLGFSQGARMAAGLLLRQQLRPDEEGPGYGFGVLLNGTCPPLGYELTAAERAVRVRTPVLVVVGKEDPWREDGRRLFAEHCEPETARLVEFEVGHRLPTIEEETKQIADEIVWMWEGGEGRESAWERK